MTSWNPGDQQPGQSGQQPGYGQQPPSYGQQPPAPNFDKGGQPPAYGQSAPPPAYGQQQPPAYGQSGGYGAPPQNQYGNNPYGAPQGGGNLPPGAVGPLNMGNRVVAFIIDYAIFVVLGIIIYAVMAATVFAAATSAIPDCNFDSNGNYNCDSSNVSAGVGAGAVIVLILLYAVLIAAGLYWVYLLGKTGQTPGKKWMGVKVVDNDSGQTIGFGRAFLRYIVQGLSNIVCYAGLWSAWLDGPPEGRYRGWHDKAVNTVVISVK